MHPSLAPILGNGVTEFFTTMLSYKIEGGLATPDTQLPKDILHVASAVGFVGELNGVVYIYCCSTFASEITARLLGVKENGVNGNEMVNDAMGELANMVVGQMKAKLQGQGTSCLLTVPSIVRGSNFTVQPVSSDERQTLCFDCNGNKLLIQFLIKI